MGTRTIIVRRGEAPRRRALRWPALGLAVAVCAIALGALAASRWREARDQGAPPTAHEQALRIQRAGEWRLYDYPRATDAAALSAQRAGERRPIYARSPLEIAAALAAQRAGERRPGQAPAEQEAALAAQRAGERGPHAPRVAAPPAGWDAYRAGERAPEPR